MLGVCKFTAKLAYFRPVIQCNTFFDTRVLPFLEDPSVKQQICKLPILSAASESTWVEAYNTFTSYGFDTKQFVRIILNHPIIVLRGSSKIIRSLEVWRSCQFGEWRTQTLITKYPILLDFSDEKDILNKVEYLKSFSGKAKNVWRLIMNSPNIIKDNEGLIDKKIDYIKNEMGFEIPQIVKSEAFSCPLTEIMCRHIFLQRLGLFKKKSPKEDSINQNNRIKLHHITDTSEKTFASKVSRVTHEEYQVFRELFHNEILKDELDHF